MSSNLDESILRDKIILAANSPRNRFLVELFYVCGLGIKEVSELNVGDVFSKHQVLPKILVSNRLLFPSHSVIIAANEYYASKIFIQPHHPLFEGRNGRIKPNVLSQLLGKIQRRAGIKGGTRHSRKFFGSSLYRNGTDPKLIQFLLGHRFLRSTNQLIDKNESLETRAKHMISVM